VEPADASVPLITSLPPNLSRQDERGAEIGTDYQERCIESWRREGFEPISVNSRDEPFRHSVRMVPVGRDASAVTGRPNVFLADLIAVAAEEAKGGPVALMNGDLVVRPGTALAPNVLQLRPGEFIFSRRIDVKRLDQTDGMPFRFGYDFFAGHAHDISRLPDGGMVFGAPWWDYFLPLMMFALGCRVYQTEPAVLHLAHGVRWMGAWEELGRRFMAEAQARVADERFSSRLGDSANWRSGNLLSDLRYFAWKRLPKNAAMERRRVLHRAAIASMSFLNEVASPRSVLSQP
jgi:hypothetical protein